MTRWIIVALAACGQPPAPAPIAPPPPAPVAVIPIDAAPLPDAAIDAPPPNELVAAGCRGSAIVSRITDIDPCATAHAPAPLPDSVTLSIEPDPLVVASGGDGSAQLVLSNHTGSDAELYLDDELEWVSSPRYEIDDAAGNRVDLLGDPCLELTARVDHVLHVAVPARGRITFAFAVHARVLRVNGGCGTHPAGPLKPGRYTLVVRVPQGEVHGRLVVR